MSEATILPDIDADYFDEVWATDLDVLERLQQGSDQPWAPRLIDVSFRGTQESLEKLAVFAERFGFVRLDDNESDPEILSIGRMQTADVLSVKELTKLSLQLEALFGVELDGWGCVAQNETPE